VHLPELGGEGLDSRPARAHVRAAAVLQAAREAGVYGVRRCPRRACPGSDPGRVAPGQVSPRDRVIRGRRNETHGSEADLSGGQTPVVSHRDTSPSRARQGPGRNVFTFESSSTSSAGRSGRGPRSSTEAGLALALCRRLERLAGDTVLTRDELAPGPSNGPAEGLRGAQTGAAGFALHREHGAESRLALGAPVPHLLAARRAKLRQRGFVLLEVALRVTARETESDPVAERLPALLAQPLGGSPHAPSVTELLDRNHGARRARRLPAEHLELQR
jgi:hypothetical protein